MDIAFLLLGSLLGIAGAIGIMLALDHFGDMEKPYFWVAIVPLPMTYWLANLFRNKLELRLNR